MYLTSVLSASSVPGIDVILGGHDHDPFTMYQGKAFIDKSRQKAWPGRLVIRKHGDKATVSPEWKMIANQNIIPEAGIEALYMAPFFTADRLEAGPRQLAVLSLPLITTTSVMRGEESNFGNLVAHAIRLELGAQFGLLNGGFVRRHSLCGYRDATHPAPLQDRVDESDLKNDENGCKYVE